MKKITAVILIAVSFCWAKNDLNPADYPLMGHVLSAEFHHSPNGQYDAHRNRWTYGAINTYSTEIQIGQLIYVSDDTCKFAKVGESYPAQIKKDWVFLLIGEKVCKYPVTGKRDSKRE